MKLREDDSHALPRVKDSASAERRSQRQSAPGKLPRPRAPAACRLEAPYCYYVRSAFGLSGRITPTRIVFGKAHSRESGLKWRPRPLGHFDAEVRRHDVFKIIHGFPDLHEHALTCRFAEHPRQSEHRPTGFNLDAQVAGEIKCMRLTRE